MIRSVRPDDAAGICAIYNPYVLETHFSFETEAVGEADMRSRIEELYTRLPFFIAESDERLIGYAYASPWKGRCAYAHSVEVSIYMDLNARGKGIGRQLYERLINELSSAAMHSLIAGIALPNEDSIRFHESFGFRKVARFKEVGRKFDRWIDVAYWQLLLDS